MNKLLTLLVLFFALGGIGCLNKPNSRNLEYAEPSGLANELNSATVALVQKSPTLVPGTVDTVMIVYQPYCTGVWVSKTIFLTAHHCIEDLGTKEQLKSGKVKVNFLDQKQVINVSESPKGTYQGVVKYFDAEHDLAMIEVKGNKPKHDIARVSNIGAGIGTKTYMVGHVQGLYYTYIEGVVSSYRQRMPVAATRNGPYMQVSAPIHLGNSGGGVFNEDGELLGICSFISARAPNASFYIPAPVIAHFLREYKVKN